MTNDVYEKALTRLRNLITEGWSQGLLEVDAAALATADSKGRPEPPPV